MFSALRTIIILALLLPAELSAQATTTTSNSNATTTTTAATSVAEAALPLGRSSDDVRENFSNLLRQDPTELATILTLDPTLLSNDAFLAGYPDLARFVAAHPEVRHNPRFYLGEFRGSDFRPEHRSPLQELIEPATVMFAFILIAFFVAWVLKAFIEQKRWSRLSQTQSEVHNKILDRFGTSAELLEYIKSPSGSKFLESAPIPLQADTAAPNAAASRVLWSVQIGIVVAAGAAGLLIVSNRFADDFGRGLFAMGVIAFSIGAGFIISAAVSMLLSRRMLASQAADLAAAER
jgi:hypothetical protein